jgi:hypothetical protein
MSDITVNVTSAGSANVSVSNGSTVNATVGNGGVVNVAIGSISPGNATVVSGTLTINSVTTLSAGSSAYVKNDAGTAYAAKLDIGIPAGPATLVSVGNTTTLASGSNATVNGTTSGSNLTLAFGIPRGANGINGVTPSFAIGNVVTGAAGSSASVSATATNSGANVTLDLTIPRGDPGTSGSNGTNGTSITLSDGTPANLGTAASGTSNLAARADHIHSLPVINYANLSNVPANFPTNTTLVSGLSAGYSGINHAHNYVTGLNNLTGNLTLAAGSNVTLTTNGSTLTLSSVGGLGANDSVDGGDYVGTIINGITFAVQPSSQTLDLGGVGNWSTGNAVPQQSALLSVGNRAMLATLAYQGYSGGNFTNGNMTLRVSSNAATVASATPYVVNVTVPAISSSLNISVASNGTQTLFMTYYSSSGSDVSTLLSTSDNGSTWSAINAPSQALRIAGASTGFVATTYSGAQDYYSSDVVRQSTDGVNWNTRTLPASTVWRIAGGGSLFVGISTSQNVSAYSTTGVSWTSATPPVAYGLRDITYGGGLYVAISTDRSYVTTNGASWTAGNLPTSGYDKVVYEGGRFVATKNVGSGDQATTDIATSVDGVTWTLGTLPASQLWRWVSYAGGYYAALPGPISSGQNLAIAAVATNGSANFTASAATSGGGAISYQWQSSTDAGTTWSNISNATTSTLSLSNLTTASSGTRYRAAASATGATTAYSQSAILTVS